GRLQKTIPPTLQKWLHFPGRRQTLRCFCVPIPTRTRDPEVHNFPKHDAAIIWSALGARRIQKFPTGSSCSQPPRPCAPGARLLAAVQRSLLPENRRRKSTPSRAASPPSLPLGSTHSGKGNLRSGLRRETPCRQIHSPACSARGIPSLFERPSISALVAVLSSAMRLSEARHTEPP